MSGFWWLLALYLSLWGLVLVPGMVVLMVREPAESLPDDDPVDDAWVRRLRRELSDRAPREAIVPGDVPLSSARARRRRSGAGPVEVLRVRGSLVVPEGAVVEACLLVEGNLRCAPGARILGPVWVRGRVWLQERSHVTSLVSDRDVRLSPGAVADGGVAAAGPIRLEPDADVTGPAVSRAEVVLSPGARVGSALAPVVRCRRDRDQEDLVPLSDARPLVEPAWMPEQDQALAELWPSGRLAELVEAIAARTGVLFRGAHVMARARRLGLFERGIPRPPAVLGRRPRWILEPDTVRVGADLRVPPGVIVSYALVVEGSLEVYQDGQLERPVRAGRGILLHARTVCFGQAVSDGLIVCEEGSAVLGPVDSSTHVLLFANARIGVPGFCGVHARGAIGLEPGARILGGAVSGLGVRGEPLRPLEQRREQVDRLPDVKQIRRAGSTTESGRRRRRRRAPRPVTPTPGQVEVHDLDTERQEGVPPAQTDLVRPPD